MNDVEPNDATRALRDDATGFEFFQAVRLLERSQPDRAPVGGFARPDDEGVRFSVPASVSFPASEIASLELPETGPARLGVNFLGLTGPQGVLPYFYTLYAAERARAKDTALRDFLDIFHHRALSLFYRAWEKQHFIVAHERGAGDQLVEHLLDLLGLGTAALQRRLPVRDESIAFYGGLLALRGRPAHALQQLVGDYFDVPCEVEQFVGAWYPVAVATQCALGDDTESTALGGGALIGDEVWDAQSRVRLRLGPLTRSRYNEFLPGGGEYDALGAIARFFADDAISVDVQLVLRREDAPGCVLGGGGAGAAPLGWCTWLHSHPPARDPDETVLSL